MDAYAGKILEELSTIMATESPIRIVEGTERWRNLKQSTRYEPPSSRIAIDSLGLFLKDQRYQSFEKDVIPSRSGSAPPNMEGSVAAIENLFSLRKSVYPGSVLPSISTINHETGLQRHADISPYHATDANVDRRFGGPLNSLESHLDIQPSVSSGNRKLPRNSLPAHEEESEDDQSSEQSGYASVDKASLLGYNSRSSDSMQVKYASYEEESLLDMILVSASAVRYKIYLACGHLQCRRMPRCSCFQIEIILVKI